jgi:sugar-specific transcriptional regulator TrmB
VNRALQRCASTLEELGFTSLEATVYTSLVGHAAETAYQVAKRIGKPTANVYKAIESLQQKGAVLVDDGDARLCRAAPPEELLRSLEASFESRHRLAESAFAQLTTSEDDDRVYQLTAVAQVYERARTMLEEARQIALLDVFPAPASRLVTDIVAAAKRVTVYVKLYAALDLPGAVATKPPDAERLLHRWPGDWLNLVVDGSQHLLAYLGRDGEQVHQAVWSSSPYLSVLHHSGMASEIGMERLVQGLDAARSIDALRKLHEHDRAQLFPPDLVGARVLLSRS